MKESVKTNLYALILAGYDKFDLLTKKKHKKEILEAYGEDIFLGENKFLYKLAGKPIIQWVIDAVVNARKGGSPIYEKIYVYNDIKTFTKAIDVSKYPNLLVRQMTDSVAGHLKDFYGIMEYGDRADIFYGDTPRIGPEDVEYIYGEFSSVLGHEKDVRGCTIHNIYSIVESEDMSDNWLTNRSRYIKRGRNKGKLKSYVGFDTFQARVGNAGSIEKLPCNDILVEYEVLNFLYSLRKVLTPSIFSKIIYYLWRGKKFKLISQIKNRCIKPEEFYLTAIDIVEKLYRIKVDEYGGLLFHIKKNAARWENDIDGPRDLITLQKKFMELQKK